MPDTCLVVMTDGRKSLIEQTVPRALSMFHGVEIGPRWIHDDSGDEDYRAWLREEFDPLGFSVLGDGPRKGFSGAYRNIWDMLMVSYGPKWVLSLEDDFLIERPVDVAAMIRVMDNHPYLVQMALTRNPVNADEQVAGGVIAQCPDDFVQMRDDRDVWLGHRRFYTTNVSLHRRSLCDLGWPKGPKSEGRFTHRLLEDPFIRFGYWGAKTDAPWTTHIGERIGSGY